MYENRTHGSTRGTGLLGPLYSIEQEKNREALNINWFCMRSRTRLATLVKKLQPFDLTIAGRRNTGYRLKRI